MEKNNYRSAPPPFPTHSGMTFSPTFVLESTSSTLCLIVRARAFAEGQTEPNFRLDYPFKSKSRHFKAKYDDFLPNQKGLLNVRQGPERVKMAAWLPWQPFF